jgi:hypothetical protein
MKNFYWRFTWCRSCGSLTLATREREICPTCFMRTIFKNKKDGRIKCCLICKDEVDEKTCLQCFQKKGQPLPESQDELTSEIRKRLDELNSPYSISLIPGVGYRVRWRTFRPYGESIENYIWTVENLFPTMKVKSALKHEVSFFPNPCFEIVADLKREI